MDSHWFLSISFHVPVIFLSSWLIYVNIWLMNIFFAILCSAWKPMVIMFYEAGSLDGTTLLHFFPEPTGAWRQREEGLAKGTSQQPEFVGPAQCGPDSQGYSW